MESIDSRPHSPEKKTLDRNRDRISDLPDAILHHILSFLDTRHAVQTSVLSTKWRYLWTSLLHLSFYTETPGNESLKDLVSKVLNFRDKSDIQLFRLYCDSESDAPRVCSWIVAAIRCKVRDIDIFMSTDRQIKLPCCLFTCKSLVELKVGLGSEYPTFKFPGKVNMPNLKVLQLTSVALMDEWATRKFISSFPSLETLVFVDCELNLLEEFVIDSPTLEHIGVQNTATDYQVGISECKIKLNAPKLKIFRCDDYMSREYFLGDIPHLERAVISMEIHEKYRYTPLRCLNIPEEEKKEYGRRATRLLQAVCNVECLTIYAWFLLVLSESAELESLPLQFHNLKHLKLQTWFSLDSLCAIMHLLKISPNIETVSLDIVKNPGEQQLHLKCCNVESITSADVDNFWEKWLSKPSMLHHLKVVRIQGVIGCMNELIFLGVVLKNAIVLEKMIIQSSLGKPPAGEIELINFSEQLLSFPRASSNIAIVFL